MLSENVLYYRTYISGFSARELNVYVSGIQLNLLFYTRRKFTV
jgi:hypothetical protein